MTAPEKMSSREIYWLNHDVRKALDLFMCVRVWESEESREQEEAEDKGRKEGASWERAVAAACSWLLYFVLESHARVKKRAGDEIISDWESWDWDAWLRHVKDFVIYLPDQPKQLSFLLLPMNFGDTLSYKPLNWITGRGSLKKVGFHNWSVT